MKKILLLLLFFVVNKNINAQWRSGGPNTGGWGNVITCLASDGQKVFACGINEGVFLSTNNGDSWVQMKNNNIGNLTLNSLVKSGNEIFSGNQIGGIFSSTDDGNNWIERNNGLTEYTVHSLALNGNRIFAGTTDSLFLSMNNGSKWTSISKGLRQLMFIEAIAVSDSNIFIGTSYGGVFLSSNNGENWKLVDSGLTNIYGENYQITVLAIKGSSIFAGTYENGVFVSDNNGSSWTPMDSGLRGSYISSFAINDTDIFVGTELGVFLSKGNSRVWKSIGLTDTTITSLTISGSKIFAGTNDAVWQRSLSDITEAQDVKITRQNYFTIFPTPASNSFILETNEPEQQLMEMFDIAGKLVLRETIISKKTTINTSSLPKGTYFVRLTGKTGIENEKLVIIR